MYIQKMLYKKKFDGTIACKSHTHYTEIFSTFIGHLPFIAQKKEYQIYIQILYKKKWCDKKYTGTEINVRFNVCDCLLKHSVYGIIFYLCTNKHFALQEVNGKSHGHALCLIKNNTPLQISVFCFHVMYVSLLIIVVFSSFLDDYI